MLRSARCRSRMRRARPRRGSRQRQWGRSARTAPRRRASEAPAAFAPGRKGGSASPRPGASRRDSDRDRSPSGWWRSRSSRRNPHPRVGASRQGQRRRQIAQIGKTGQKAQHVDVVPRAAVQCHDLTRSEPGQPRHLGEIGGEFALVAHRDSPQPAGGLPALVAVEQPGDDLLRSAREVESGS